MCPKIYACRNDCPNVHPKQPCHPGSAEECVVWIAREYVAAGQPVCNYYKWMTNDISLLQYGWLQVCMCGSCNMRDQGVMAACTVLYCECCARGLHFFVPT
jgi:hypothetical protein